MHQGTNWRYVIGVIPGKLGTDKLRHVTGQQLSNQQQHNLHVGGTVTDWPIEGVMVFDPQTGNHVSLIKKQLLEASTSTRRGASG